MQHVLRTPKENKPAPPRVPVTPAWRQPAALSLFWCEFDLSEVACLAVNQGRRFIMSARNEFIIRQSMGSQRINILGGD